MANLNDAMRTFFGAAQGEHINDAMRRYYGLAAGQNLQDALAGKAWPALGTDGQARYFADTAFGVFGADTLAKKQAVKAIGATHVIIPAYWDRLQGGGSGSALNGGEVTNLNTQLSDAKSAGLRVMLEASVQYPPAWALTAIPKFADQDGNLYSKADNAAGDNVRDWVWSQVGRTALADFIAKVYAAITDTSMIAGVRIGGMQLNELQYPGVGGHPYRFWCYSAAAKDGTGIATGMSYMTQSVGAGGAGTGNTYAPYSGGGSDADFAAWYIDSLKRFMLWQVATWRAAGYSGPLHVLHPSYGRRGGITPDDWGYQESTAQGQDWDTLVAAYAALPDVWPWSSWVDRDDFFTPVGADTDKSPQRKLREIAVANGKAAKLYGENTGGQTNSDLDRVFSGATGALKTGYHGYFHLNYDLLVAGGANATLAYLGTKLRTG